ncbi:hypothetical protein [Caballeronia sp. GaOx3]|uniref:hypothetical protein n=1 Tax=Caballeronia sp. GaOx3 TaxID=2921740 RepID=UPI002028A601|nr:hypothetical protein [Caballeronia sp. GaOx3]
MSPMCLVRTLSSLGPEASFDFGEVEIAAGRKIASIDVSEKLPGGVLGALFSDVGSGALPYSYELSSPCSIVVHAPLYVIRDGKIVKRDFPAIAQWLAVGKNKA